MFRRSLEPKRFYGDPDPLARDNIVACQAHPALVKIGPVLVQYFFIFDSSLACIHVLDYNSVIT